MPSDLVGIVGDVDSPEPHCEMMFAAQQCVGDYHGNFTHAIFLKWLRNRFIPWALHAHPQLAVGPPGAQPAKLCLMLDNAPYHTGSTEGGGGGLRFNPLTAPKGALFAGMAQAGCAALQVTHTFAAQGGAASRVVSVPMTEAGAALRGRAGVFPSAGEVQLAALQWLAEHCPAVLENDAEALLREGLNGNAYVLWNAPNFPELMAIELVWAQEKAYVGTAWRGARGMAALARDAHQGLYTEVEAAPGVLRVRGGGFVGRGEGGACPAAAALFRHVLHSPGGGAQAHIEASARLRGEGVGMATLVVPQELQGIVGLRCRNAMLYKQAQLLASGGAVALGEACEEEVEDDVVG